MKIYFDESYPGNQEKMILGALFLSDGANKFLSDEFRKIKKKYGITSELKYTELDRKKRIDAAKECVNLILNSKRTVYFRACILPYSNTGLNTIPGTNLHTKRVGMYSLSAKTLVLSNLPPDESADLIMDKEDRIERTKFKKKIKKATASKGGKITSVVQVDSKAIATELIQICDLLTGSVLQCLYPTNTKKGRFKKEFGAFVADAFNIEITDKKKKVKSSDNKFSVGFWKLPNVAVLRRHHKQKSRS